MSSRDPIYSTLPDGRRVQRLDTVPQPWVGRHVFHPMMQAGERCAWTAEQRHDLQMELFGRDFDGPDGLDGVTYDEGRVFDAFPDPISGMDVRFDTSGGSLRYGASNVWVEVPDAP